MITTFRNLLVIFSTAIVVAAQSPPPLEDQLKTAVFRMEAVYDGSYSPNGTGFLIEHNHKIYLVSARHVAEAPSNLRARVPLTRRDTGILEPVELWVPKGAWVFHSEGPSKGSHGVDVAVAPLPGVPSFADVRVFGSCSPCQAGETSQLAQVDPKAPLSVLVTGFPGGIGYELKEQRPFYRSAIVALVPGERLIADEQQAFYEKDIFLIDRAVQKGTSGSPVFYFDQIKGVISVVGLQIATNNENDFSIIEPASRIRETLEQASTARPAAVPSWRRLP